MSAPQFTPEPCISLACPVEPHELDKNHRYGMNELARSVVAACAARGVGRDLMLRVYMAGIYHGVELFKARGDQ